MSKKCPECKGKGRWQVKETYSDGDELLTWYECGTCNGKGAVPDDDDEQAPENTFDIGGSSYDEDD